MSIDRRSRRNTRERWGCRSCGATKCHVAISLFSPLGDLATTTTSLYIARLQSPPAPYRWLTIAYTSAPRFSVKAVLTVIQSTSQQWSLDAGILSVNVKDRYQNHAELVFGCIGWIHQGVCPVSVAVFVLQEAMKAMKPRIWWWDKSGSYSKSVTRMKIDRPAWIRYARVTKFKNWIYNCGSALLIDCVFLWCEQEQCRQMTTL